MKQSPIIVIMAVLLLVGSARLETRSTPTPTCDRPGATGMDKVLFPENGENHLTQYWESHMEDYLKWLMPVR